MPDSLYVIDVYSLLFQVFHAIPPMTGPSGQPTNAVFGFTRDLLTILKDKRPCYLICAKDSSGPGTRSEISADYKANRGEMPDELRVQIPMLLDVLEAFRVPVIEHAGWEADDVIATVAVRAAEQGIDVRIVTNDKDARQLIGPHVQLYNCRKDSYLDEQALLDDWGIRPDQVIDFQSLVGDSVDNIRGIPLVGPKKASALLNQFGTLEEVLAHADEAPGAKLRENLKKFADVALKSRRLVTLNTELPIEIDLECSRACRPDVDRLLDLFRELGFRRFGDEVRALAPQPAAAAQGMLFSGIDWRLVDTSEKFDKFLAELKGQRTFCLDLETTCIDAVRAEIVGWAFSWEAGRGYYIPVRGPKGDRKLPPTQVSADLRPILENPEVEIVNQNIKYEMLVLRRAGIQLRRASLDPMVGHYLLDAGARSHGLDALAEQYLGHCMIPITDLIGTGRNQKCMDEVPVERVAEYAVEDATIAWQLSERIAADLKREGLWDLYWTLERPLIPVLADMEHAGIRVDTEELRRQSEELGARLDGLVARIHAEAGCEFNIDSPLQLRKVLFEDRDLPVLKKTKTGPSTDQDVLEELARISDDPLPALITEHRHLSKLKGTYLDALPTMVNPETGRIHACFNQVVAATGRLSSSDPNLQNIPIRTEVGQRIRRAFVPGEPGWKLLSADYSQIELRILAHFSGDPVLQAAFAAGTDIHTAVASQVFSVDTADVTPEMRRVAKAVNYGVVYGQSPFGLAAVLNIPQEQAARFIEDYFTLYSGVARYLEQILDESAKSGYATTILGRRRQIQGIRPAPACNRSRNMPERTAINSVIQGSAADLIKRAMIALHARLERDAEQGRMLLQIHDELVFEVPAGAIPNLAAIVREEMESALTLDVPIVVDISVGDNWLDTQPL